MIFRKAVKSELKEIFLLGYDVWGQDMDKINYLESCFSSKKYKKGEWWVMESDGEIVSSLILYKFQKDSFGIGSIATALNFRCKGLASKLIVNILEIHESECKPFFLYSDIDPSFYIKHRFKILPDKFQKYNNSICMSFGDLSDLFETPDYF